MSVPLYHRLTLAFSFSLVLLLGGCTRSDHAAKDNSVVRVNDRFLSAESFADLLAEKLRAYNSISAQNSKVLAELKSSIINDFIIQSLTLQAAENLGLFVRKEDLESEVEQIKKQYPDDFAFRRALAEANLPYQQWEEKQRSNLLKKMVATHILKKVIPPTETESKFYYQKNLERFKRPDQIKVQQVVLKTEEQAKMILKELKKGRKIEDLARKFSIGPEASSGGHIGWVSRGTHELFNAAFRLGVGGITQVIKSPFGYHIFKVTARRSAKTLAFNEVKDQIYRDLLAEKEQQAYSKWLEAELLSAKVYKNEKLIETITVQARSL